MREQIIKTRVVHKSYPQLLSSPAYQAHVVSRLLEEASREARKLGWIHWRVQDRKSRSKDFAGLTYVVVEVELLRDITAEAVEELCSG